MKILAFLDWLIAQTESPRQALFRSKRGQITTLIESFAPFFGPLPKIQSPFQNLRKLRPENADQKNVKWPQLNSKFFQDHPPRRDIYARHESAFPWSPQALPVYEWQDLIYIASSHPDEILKQKEEWPAHWILLQADPQALQELWQNWREPQTAAAFAPLFPPPPSPLEDFSEITQPRINLASLKHVEDAENIKTLPESPRPVAATAPLASPSPDFQPDELIETLEKTVTAKRHLARSPLEKDFDLSQGFPDAEAFSLEPVPAKDQPSEEILNLQIEGERAPGDNEILRILQERPDGYSSSLVAVKAGNSLHLVQWSLPEQVPPGQESDFSLGVPSPFRIALRTEKPYHGAVVPSDLMDHFFKHWNANLYPECLTVIPLVQEGVIQGFLINLGTSRALSKSHLLGSEQMAEEIRRLWTGPWIPAQSA